MGHLAHYANLPASWLKVKVPWMIEQAITAPLNPLRASIDALSARVELKSRDFASLFETVEIPDDLSVEVPPATTGDDIM
ncbi:hypothetical protein H5410_020981 [Solanum commersonii]|uniref:Uncharacterized protein n=1 Tax=Solanum commersonii TaxID=4109 RepID=A0A9J5ZDU8_SOLCO|nr:hypothetical protein H5410_020981 [Solanum commersonii]